VTDDGDDVTRAERRLRLRAFVGDYRGAVAVALVVLVLAGGWLAGTAYLTPGTTTDERVVSSWERTSQFTHGATVTRPAGVFDRGERLRNRSVYFTRVAPVVDVRYAVGYATAGDGSLDARVQIRLVRRAITETEAGGRTVLWRTERVLTTRNESGVPPGEQVTVPASVNVTAVATRTDELVSQLGASPGEVEVALVADVRLTGRVDGRPATRSYTQEVELALDGATYGVTGQATARDTVEATRVVERPRSYGPAHRIGGPVLLGAGLLGLVGVAVARSRGALTVDAADRDWLAYRQERSEFDEWIHTVELPDEARELPQARAGSLADLVDLAIDVDAAVLESPAGGTFSVVHGGYRYVYEAPERSTSPRASGTGDRTVDQPPAASEPRRSGAGLDAEAGAVGDHGAFPDAASEAQGPRAEASDSQSGRDGDRRGSVPGPAAEADPEPQSGAGEDGGGTGPPGGVADRSERDAGDDTDEDDGSWFDLGRYRKEG
jgi:hypothetical protein